MKRIILIIELLCLSWILSACAPMPVKRSVLPQPTKEIFIRAEFDDVWKTTAGVIAEFYPISILDKESGLITTEFKRIPSSTMERIAITPSELFLPSWGDGRARLTVVTKPENSQSTRIRITPFLEWWENVHKEWKIVDPAPAFYDEIVEEIVRRSQ